MVSSTMVTSENRESENEAGPLIPDNVVGIAALLCGVVLVLIAVLGPLGLGVIEYRTSDSGLSQLKGQDIADLLLIAPILFIGGILQLLRRDSSKYFLILTPITLMYTGLSIGIGQEWSDPSYSGNVEDYFWLYLALVVGGLILLIGSLSMFTESDAPDFNRKSLRRFVILISVFLSIFAIMWIAQVVQVSDKGDLEDGSYSDAPTLFWMIRYLDLGISVPVGYLALYLLMTKPKKAYHLTLLFFGFFITMAAAVNAMVAVQIADGDSSIESMGPAIAIFPILGLLAFMGLYYLVRDKVHIVRGSDCD